MNSASTCGDGAATATAAATGVDGLVFEVTDFDGVTSFVADCDSRRGCSGCGSGESLSDGRVDGDNLALFDGERDSLRSSLAGVTAVVAEPAAAMGVAAVELSGSNWKMNVCS